MAVRGPCDLCGASAPRGRHKSCAVLDILQDGRAHEKRALMRAVYPERRYFEGELFPVDALDGAIKILRDAGHRILSIDGYVRLRTDLQRSK